jgi:hypothetical protein
MKCYRIVGSGCSTEAVVGWMVEKDGPYMSGGLDSWDGWVPRNDTSYEIGGNTWHAAGPLTNETAKSLKDLWIGTGSETPLNNSHVIGKLHTQPWIDTVVDQVFVDAMSSFDDQLFSFLRHDRVWDRGRECPPWDGPFYIATLLPLRPSYDLERSDLVLSMDRAKRFEGGYGSTGARRVIKASTTLETSIWRDAYTREVMCTEEARGVLDAIGIREWDYYPQNIADDR